MESIERKKREMEEVNDRPRRLALFSRFLLNTESYVRDTKRGQYKARMVDFSQDCDRITMEIPEATFLVGTKLFFSKFVGRYVQIEGVVGSVSSGYKYILDISSIRFAKKSRVNLRVSPPKELVYANNFKLTRAAIELDSISVPTYVKITFQDYENRLIKNFDYIKIDIFRPGMPDKFFLVKHSGKTFYIPQTQDKNSYRTDNDEEFLNCEEEFLDDIKEMISQYRHEKIVSEVIMPILYVNSTMEAATIGFVHIQSKTKPIEYEAVMETKLLTLEMIDRIRESNTLVYTQRAEILNLSPDGLRVRVTDPELKQQIPLISGFTMDIVFKTQTPINISVLVRNLVRDANDDMLIGLEIDGFRKGDKERFIHNLKVLSRPAKN